jgi:hypothetical protein
VYGLYDRDGEGALSAFEAGMMGSKISYKSEEMKTVPLLTACFYARNVLYNECCMSYAILKDQRENNGWN